MTPLPKIMLAPNGARLTKADHPALPMTPAEILETTQACRAEGVDGLHLHLRDADGKHLLDADAYADALDLFRAEMPDFPVQITTEAVGMYDPTHQRHVALNSGADMVSASVRELCRDDHDVTRAFYDDCHARGIAVQHILYDVEDAALLTRVLDEELLTAPELQLIFVLGRYAVGQKSDPKELDPFLSWLKATGLSPDWAVCAFGPGETPALLRTVQAGGKCRIGFENSRQHADGTVATDNAARVAELVKACTELA
ncbi:3-keto-5-aminohexanoate cleavage protein [Aliiroseovarius marinus]|uniref:3-keto-5-aminohexanoate cleavage protein n=1 Tax=Aliiroseovarius marinus TaxID=2500159 RepID=UPI0024959755|nr:3-keto-5-aminohexanoate cleavage protein [Aliiroseovarius marinus]